MHYFYIKNLELVNNIIKSDLENTIDYIGNDSVSIIINDILTYMSSSFVSYFMNENEINDCIYIICYKFNELISVCRTINNFDEIIQYIKKTFNFYINLSLDFELYECTYNLNKIKCF